MFAPEGELPKIAEQGKVLVLEGAAPSASEMNMAKYLASLGRRVEILPERTIESETGFAKTADFRINGELWDVYSPTTSNLSRIVSKVAAKAAQVKGGGVIIDLSGTSVTVEQAGVIAARVSSITKGVGKVLLSNGNWSS
jgi:hypothetical protein